MKHGQVNEKKLLPPGQNSVGGYKLDLAKLILLFGIGTVGLLGGLAIIFSATWSPAKDVFGSVKDILTLLLPVISAWVGTVLAYYFSKDNFESATRSTSELYKEFRTSEEKLRSITALEVMIPIDKAIKLILDKKESEIKLKADIIDAKLVAENKKRLPVLDKGGIAKYMIHRSTIDEFIVQEVDKGKNLDDLTLQNMLDDEKFNKTITQSFGCVKETSSLAEAKEYVDRIALCQDIFITESGEPNTSVTGWITNVIITKNAIA